MAGGGDQKENPVAINVVPMVDVIFCLCIFFMCSFKFKESEGKFEPWLPRDKGADVSLPAIIEELRIKLAYDDVDEVTIRRIGHNQIDDDARLGQLIAEAHADHVRLGKPDVPVIIDAGIRVPWREVIRVMNIIRLQHIERMEFAMGERFLDSRK